jgi:hypothetical protein
MLIGRADDPQNPGSPVAIKGRPCVWEWIADPIWASGQRAAQNRPDTRLQSHQIRSSHSQPLHPVGRPHTGNAGGPVVAGYLQRTFDRFQGCQVEMAGCAIDVETDHLTLFVQIDTDTIGDLACFRAGLAAQFDVEAIRFRVVVQLHGNSWRNPRSKNAQGRFGLTARASAQGVAVDAGHFHQMFL